MFKVVRNHYVIKKCIFSFQKALCLLSIQLRWLVLFSQGPEEPQEAESDQYTKDQTTSKSAKVGQVMTEEEYEEWRKEREGGKPDEQDAGIDWGMGEI